MELHWISVDKQLPETTGQSTSYITLLANGQIFVCNWMNIGGWDWAPKAPIIAWMEIPEPL